MYIKQLTDENSQYFRTYELGNRFLAERISLSLLTSTFVCIVLPKFWKLNSIWYFGDGSWLTSDWWRARRYIWLCCSLLSSKVCLFLFFNYYYWHDKCLLIEIIAVVLEVFCWGTIFMFSVVIMLLYSNCLFQIWNIPAHGKPIHGAVYSMVATTQWRS